MQAVPARPLVLLRSRARAGSDRLSRPRLQPAHQARRDRHLRRPVLRLRRRRATRRRGRLSRGRVLDRRRRRQLAQGRHQDRGAALLGLDGRQPPWLGGRADRHDPAYHRRRPDLGAAAEPQGGRGLPSLRGAGDRREHRLGGRRVGHAHPHHRRRCDLERSIAHHRSRAPDVRVALDAGPGAGAKEREGLRGRRPQQRLLSARAQPEVLDRRRVRLHLLVRRPRRDVESGRDPGLRAHGSDRIRRTTRSRSARPTRSGSGSSRRRSSTPRT